MINPKQKRKLDRLFSVRILGKNNRTCQRCGVTGKKMDTSHIIPREYLNTRYEPLNAICLCVSCHKYGLKSWHKNPLFAVRWLDTFLGPEIANTLLSSSFQPFTGSYEDLLNNLK